jgi:hypothetical protein
MASVASIAGVAGLGLGAVTAPAAAQAGDPAEAFGGFDLTGRANGVQVTYNVEDVFPLPPPIFQLSVPEASATTSTGPSASALGSSAYPGNVLGNLPAIVEQSSPGNGQFIPPYPLAARADHPAGPAEASQDIGTATTRVAASESGAQAVTTMAGGDVPGLVILGAITTSARTGFEDGQVVSRSRSEIASIDLLFGLIHLEGVVTDLVATSDGTTAATGGSTTVASVSVLGLPATIGPDGLVVSDPAPAHEAGPLAPLATNLTGPLGQAGDGLATATGPVNEGLRSVLAAAGGSMDEALAQAGIHLALFEPVATVDGPEAAITANGIVLDITYDGRGDNPLATLLAAVPSDQLPGEGLPGVPLNTSPQALVNLLKETHVQGLALAYGTAEVTASPAFSFTVRLPSRLSPSSLAGAGAGRSGAAGARPAGFSTPTPALAPGAAAVDGEAAAFPRGAAVGALAVVLTLLSAPVWAVGSRRLADAALAGAPASCPDGRS